VAGESLDQLVEIGFLNVRANDKHDFVGAIIHFGYFFLRSSASHRAGVCSANPVWNV
jgi:hypothetical protein